MLHALYHKATFRAVATFNVLSPLRRIYWRLRGMKIGRGTSIPRIVSPWPHQVVLGERCLIGDGVVLHFDGIYQSGPRIQIGDRCFIGRNCEFNISDSIQVGDNALIASGCKFIDHNHGIDDLTQPMNVQRGPSAPIALEDDVWLGVNVVVLKGVKIGRGAVVAAGSVVTKSIPPQEIWGGIPARFIRRREQSNPNHVRTASP